LVIVFRLVLFCCCSLVVVGEVTEWVVVDKIDCLVVPVAG
jgi:hypothetical protein